MLKSLVAASALALLAVTGFGGTAQANGWTLRALARIGAIKAKARAFLLCRSL